MKSSVSRRSSNGLFARPAPGEGHVKALQLLHDRRNGGDKEGVWSLPFPHNARHKQSSQAGFHIEVAVVLTVDWLAKKVCHFIGVVTEGRREPVFESGNNVAEAHIVTWAAIGCTR